MKKIRLLVIILGVFCLAGCAQESKGNRVSIVKDEAGYTLMLNGKPFYIQGAGVGKWAGQKGENYLKMARDMGANTVRTWGTDQGDQAYLDEAWKNGLYVDAGIWMNYVDAKKSVSYISDPAYIAKKEKEIVDYVTRFKHHPAVLMWNIGNEVMTFTKNKEERVAFCHTLEKIVQEVHKLDPDHPVIYTSAGTGELPYLAKYVPSLDGIGINTYGSIIMVESSWKTLGFEKPYVITEFGPLGGWDLPKDSNGRYIEESDISKAAQYRNHWRLIKERKGKNIGGFVFHLGETTQDSLTNWNINFYSHPKESYLMMRSLYTGAKITDHAPRIKSFGGAPKKIGPFQVLEIDISAEDPEGGPLKYDFMMSTAIEGVLEYYVNTVVPVNYSIDGAHITIEPPAQNGLYRMYAIVYDQAGNAAVTNTTLQVGES